MGWKASAVLLVLALGITAARAQQFAPSLIDDFRHVCLSDLPFEDTLADVGTVGHLTTPDGGIDILFAESRETVPTVERHRKVTGQIVSPAYTIYAIRRSYHGRALKRCEVRTYIDLDLRSDLRTLIDALADLEQPSSTISDDIAATISGAGRPDFDSPQWRVRSEPDSAVILYMSDGATTLTRIGPAE